MLQPVSYISEGKHHYYICGVRGFLNCTVNIKYQYIRWVKICKSCTQLHGSLLYQNHNVAQFCYLIKTPAKPQVDVISNYEM
jgi:hypothetical protein